MNVELKRIAESKVRQLGGDVCGVLVRKDGRLAAVDEHGRVQWLQSGQGAEPVAKIVSGYSGDPDTWNDLEIKPLDLSGCKVNDLLYTQPHPAQQGSVPKGENDFGLDARYFHEKLSLILRGINSYTPTEMARALGRLAITANPETMREPEFNISDLIDQPKYRDATPQPAQQGSVPDGFSEFVSAVRSINRSSHHQIQIPGDDEPCFWQRKEWIDWILELADQVEDSLSAATPQPQGDGWIKCSERLPTEADGDFQGGVFFCAEGWKEPQYWHTEEIKAVAEDRPQLVATAHWKPTGLKRPQPPQEGE